MEHIADIIARTNSGVRVKLSAEFHEHPLLTVKGVAVRFSDTTVRKSYMRDDSRLIFAILDTSDAPHDTPYVVHVVDGKGETIIDESKEIDGSEDMVWAFAVLTDTTNRRGGYKVRKQTVITNDGKGLETTGHVWKERGMEEGFYGVGDAVSCDVNGEMLDFFPMSKMDIQIR